MVNRQRVLVVDGMHEIQDVLRTVLAPRGLRVDWIRSHSQVVPNELESKPDLLVIDAETCIDRSEWRDVPQVLLEGDTAVEESDTSHSVLRKPFHFKALVAAIERLLPKQMS